MALSLDDLTAKVDNGGVTPDGLLTAEEYNTLLAAVKENAENSTDEHIGSVVVDNTLSALVLGSKKPVDSMGIAEAIEVASNSLKERGYIYMGVATPTTKPNTTAGKVFYLAVQAGEYTNFGYTLPPDALTSLEWDGERWFAIRIADLVTPAEVQQAILDNTASEVTEDGTNPVSGGAVAKHTALVNTLIIDKSYATINGYYRYMGSKTLATRSIIDSSAAITTHLIKLGSKLKGRAYLGGPTHNQYCIIYWNASEQAIGRYTGSAAGVQDFELSSFPEGAVCFSITTLASMSEHLKLTTNAIYEVKDESAGESLEMDTQLLVTGITKRLTLQSNLSRGSVYISNVPWESGIKMRVLGDLSYFLVYKCTKSYGEPSLLYPGKKKMGEWFELPPVDEAKPCLYITNPDIVEVDKQSKIIVDFSHNPSGGLDSRVDSLEAEASTSNWASKAIVCFGDSITEFKDSDGKGWCDYFAEATGATVYNIAIGGTQYRQRAIPVSSPSSTTQAYAALDIVNMVKASCDGDFTKQESAASYLAQNANDDNTNIIAKAKNIVWEDVHAVVLFGGTNDWNNAISSIGTPTSEDVNTSFGAVNIIVQTLLSKYPKLALYFVTPTVRWIDYSGDGSALSNFSDNIKRGDLTLKEFVEQLKQVIEAQHQPICDVYNTLGWNIYNFAEYFESTDGTHPIKGFKPLGLKIAAFIKSNQTF